MTFYQIASSLRKCSVLLDSGHFVWEDRAEGYATAIQGVDPRRIS
jgi:hypothetical protein